MIFALIFTFIVLQFCESIYVVYKCFVENHDKIQDLENKESIKILAGIRYTLNSIKKNWCNINNNPNSNFSTSCFFDNNNNNNNYRYL